MLECAEVSALLLAVHFYSPGSQIKQKMTIRLS